MREGEFCKIQGAKIKFNNSKISESSLIKIDHLQTVLSVFEGELEFTTYLQANLVLQNGVQVSPTAFSFPTGVFSYMNWKEFGGLPGKTISGLEGSQFLRTFMQTNGALSLMLSQDEGKMSEPSDYMNVVFELDGGFSIPYDLTHAGLDLAWIDCVGSVAARVTERRKKQLGLN